MKRYEELRPAGGASPYSPDPLPLEETAVLPDTVLPDTVLPETVLDGVVPRELAPETIEDEPPAEPRSPWLRFAAPALGLIAALGGLEVLRARFQKNQLFNPTRYPDGEWDSKHDLPCQDVWLTSADGTRLHGWWIETPRSLATVMYCHGNAGCIVDRVEIFALLRRLKVNVFAFDYRGFGKSEGSPSPDGIFMDVRAAIDHVTGDLGVPPSRLILFGHSMGGAVAIDGAVNRPDIAGLVVQSTFTDINDMARHFYPGIPMHLIARNEIRSIEKVPDLRMPKLFIHGTEDVTIPFHMGERLYAAAAGPKAWYPVRGADHSDLHLHGKMAYFRVLTRFRQRCVHR
jgi:fermentation-respiration switch protein FrsA (DUF1100 family)